MKINKKYIVNVSCNFEDDDGNGCRQIVESLYFDHKPTKKEVKKLMKQYKCKYVHIGKYYKLRSEEGTENENR